MSKPKEIYVLSFDADKDLDEIFDYTENEFGFRQAVNYLETFEPLFNRLLHNPNLGRSRNDIKVGLRSIIKEEHVVFYRIMKNHIRIVRVLHTSQDLPSFFKF